MKIKSEDVYIGDIMLCTKYEYKPTLVIEDFAGCMSFGSIHVEEKVYKEDAILIKISEDRYVDVDELNNLLDYLKLYKNKCKKQNFDEIVLGISARKAGALFVKNVEPHYIKGMGKVKVKDIKLKNLGSAKKI